MKYTSFLLSIKNSIVSLLFIFQCFFGTFALANTNVTKTFGNNQAKAHKTSLGSEMNGIDTHDEHQQVDSGEIEEQDNTHLRQHSSQSPISIFWLIPFASILLCIALCPLLVPHFWHHNYWKISIFLFAIPMFVICLFFLGESIYHQTLHEMQSYVSFITLLASLYTIAGGIEIQGNMQASPKLNLLFLGTGSILASFMATTGASMLLIRPLIRSNATRKYKTHTIIFFIFCVSNTGGLLTPLGDPPLFLGYLKGVPFTWTFHLFPEWLFVNTILLTIYFVWDYFLFKKENHTKHATSQANILSSLSSIQIVGKIQFLFLGGVIASIFLQGHFAKLSLSDATWAWWPTFGMQEAFMGLMLLCSLWMAPLSGNIRKANQFTWFPLKEVACLFLGIFACMIPALHFLNLHGHSLGLSHPWQFFWITGSLSSLLDNAPTYLVFLEIAKSIMETDIAGIVSQAEYLKAISCGAVFMGAMTYIGNAPNFMVSSIARENHIQVPSFFGYIAYSGVILLPTFLLLTLIFF